MQGEKWLEGLAEQMTSDIKKGAAPSPDELTVREFLYRFGFRKRASHQVSQIRESLRRNELIPFQLDEAA